MSLNFSDMPWVVTITHGGQAGTYGPLSMDAAVELRDEVRASTPDATVEAWAAQAPNLNVVKSPSMLDAAA